MRARASLAILVSAVGLSLPASAQAAPTPLTTSFSAVTQTSATLEAGVDPGEAAVKDAHFEYLPLASYETEGFAGALPTERTRLPASIGGSGDLTAASAVVTNFTRTTTAGTLSPGMKIEGAGIPAATTINEIGAGTLTLSKAATATETGVELTITGPQPLSAPVAGLSPGTGYVFRVLAEGVPGPATTFYTYAAAPLFAPCPNDALRTGPSALLPDCRAYEQASPVDKNGNDAIGEFGFSHAASDGSAATFLATSGIPGGDGAQQTPAYVATRGAGGWTSTGLDPQATAGPKALVLGWTPDFSATVTQAERRSATTRENALFVRFQPGAPATQASAYVPLVGNDRYAYAGASADGQTVVFEVPRALPPREGEATIPGASPDSPNVYAYDAATGLVSLAGAMNTEEETEAALPKGTFAGPYDWANHHSDEGGSTTAAYTVDQRAVAADGSVFFTASGTGRLYERINPTEPQSEPGPDGYFEAGHCAEPAKACTIEVSATEKANGGPAHDGPDPAGAQPAAFQAASADGTQAFFTSSEKLTDDANTGPEQLPAAIGVGPIAGGSPEDEEFIPKHALGLAVDSKGEYIYWVEPVKHSIARADLKAPNPETTVEDEFIDTGETENITFDNHGENGHTQKGHSTPRYVAVGLCAGGGECVYWTNTGPLGNNIGGKRDGQQPIEGGGTIGRARLKADGSGIEGPPKPDFITGASNPQGIAVDSEHIYWVNNGDVPRTETIGRADLAGTPGSVDQAFVEPRFGKLPAAVALSPTQIYFTWNDLNGNALVSRVPLTGSKEGKEEEGVLIGDGSKLRGIAVDADNVYWAAQGEEAIGRIPIADFPGSGVCETTTGCEKNFIPVHGAPLGLAAGASHLYWSVNGEAPSNPGNDLYRWSATADAEGHHLTDLTPVPAEPGHPDGAEVIGVLGTTPDGSRTYFLANGDLDGPGPGFQGDCQGTTLVSTSGRCGLYLSHDGQISFVAPLRLGGRERANDVANVIPRARGIFSADASVTEKSSFLAADGTLVFRSQEDQLPYETGGVAEFYRFAPSQGLSCLTCDPAGGPSALASVEVALGFPGMAPAPPGFTMPRPLSSEGGRFFFQSAGAMVAADTDGQAGCPLSPNAGAHVPSCQDVYEWEAPGVGSCQEGVPPYSPLNHGCLYLLSPGDDSEPSFFSDASADGDSVFFYTRDQLVGQDEDGLLDLYAARVEGGLASQNPLPATPCEGEASCKPGVTPAPGQISPRTPGFVGPENPKRPKCPKGKKLRKGKCVKQKQRKKHGHKRHRGQRGGHGSR